MKVEDRWTIEEQKKIRKALTEGRLNRMDMWLIRGWVAGDLEEMKQELMLTTDELIKRIELAKNKLKEILN